MKFGKILATVLISATLATGLIACQDDATVAS